MRESERERSRPKRSEIFFFSKSIDGESCGNVTSSPSSSFLPHRSDPTRSAPPLSSFSNPPKALSDTLDTLPGLRQGQTPLQRTGQRNQKKPQATKWVEASSPKPRVCVLNLPPSRPSLPSRSSGPPPPRPRSGWPPWRWPSRDQAQVRWRRERESRVFEKKASERWKLLFVRATNARP